MLKNKKTKKTYLLKTFYIGCFIIVIISLTFFNLTLFLTYKKTSPKSKISSSKHSIIQREYYLSELLKKNPEYISGWLELARIELKLGNKKRAREFLLKAKEIDPNSKELKELMEII